MTSITIDSHEALSRVVSMQMAAWTDYGADPWCAVMRTPDGTRRASLGDTVHFHDGSTLVTITRGTP